ncbi:pimeloyl-ACP methyl ester carboxylesterase [Pontibacter mucosus]|uniref:Pimeloyl-ACP methyl ester carboxylesterase n=1 Tax=Pontibacter mucosus TaxID=1649266 RepID=A0A2T5YD90_9BACT|nr:alpha/beta fold hydrolase [Pontibacter mucosus]PTX14486.1 pimeloyl-ACP methyl ester carboxylesterase [Pontibacter mucosus]
MRIKSQLTLALLLAGLLSLNARCQTATVNSEPAVATATADPVFESLKYNFPVQKATLPDGQTIAYVDQGKGPQTIIFIHGLGSYLPAWNKNIAELSQHYRTIALDLPGYGKSSKENAQVGMKAYADAVLALMDELKIKQAVLTGHSMGGQIAITAALQAPERVQKLILAAPAGLETFTGQQKQLFKATVTPESIAKTTPEQISANIKVNFHQMPDDAQFMVEERVAMMQAAQFPDYTKAVAQGVAAMVDEPVYDRLPELKVPTLILFGENDALIPNRYLNPDLTTQAVANIGRERITDSQVKLLPQAGHMLQFEQPEAFNQAVRAFLD